MTANWTPEVSAALAPEGRTLYITLGSPLRSDDGMGPLLYSLAAPASPEVKVLDGGTTPENLSRPAARFAPAKIVVLDAAHFGGEAGELRELPLRELDRGAAVSTHSIPLSLIFTMMARETGARLALVGVQAASLEPREGLSPAVEAAARELAAYINSL